MMREVPSNQAFLSSKARHAPHHLLIDLRLCSRLFGSILAAGDQSVSPYSQLS